MNKNSRGYNIYDKAELKKLQASAHLASKALKLMLDLALPGNSTKQIDQAVEIFLKDNNATPSFKTIEDYNYATCISVNEMIVHGKPSDYILKEGDVVSLDVGVCLDGYNSDNARTIVVGDSPQHRKLIKVGEEAFFKAFEVLKSSNLTGDIGSAIHRKILSYLDEKNEPIFKVFYLFQGHGIGKALHEPPLIPNMGFPGTGTTLEVGTSICIEPIVLYRSSEIETVSDTEIIKQFKSHDLKPSSHYENHIYISDSGPTILTNLDLF